jgi:hypothetical protein
MNTSMNMAKRPRPGSSLRQRLPLITLNKTFLLTKINFNKKRFATKNILEDQNQNIKSFELITDLNLLLVITKNNELRRFKILEMNGKLYEEKKNDFKGEIQGIYQIAYKKIMILIFNGKYTRLIQMDPETLEILFKMKLNEKVPVNKMTFYDESNFFVFVSCLSKKNLPSEKVYLFNNQHSSPRKCFMLSGTQIVDCCMPTASNLFVGCRPNELKFFKISFGSNKPFVFDFTLKLKANVRSIEIFHKNNNILLANCNNSDVLASSVIYIVNTLSKEIINTIIPQQFGSSPYYIKSLTTITVLSKKPEIYLLGFGDGEIRICDIDNSMLENQLESFGGGSWRFRDSICDLKQVKILSQNKNGDIAFLAITREGIVMINLN